MRTGDGDNRRLDFSSPIINRLYELSEEAKKDGRPATIQISTDDYAKMFWTDEREIGACVGESTDILSVDRLFGLPFELCNGGGIRKKHY